MAFARRKAATFRSLLHLMTRRCRGPLRRGVRLTEADRYVKRYRSVDFALALVYHFIGGVDSVRQLKTRLDHDRQLRRHVRLGGISNAQLPKLLQRRPPALWEPLLATLVSALNAQKAPSAVRLMDTSFFAMCVKLFSRVQGREYEPEAAGVKLGLIIDPVTSTPQRWDCQLGQGSDVLHCATLLPKRWKIKGLTFIFDRGFLSYDFWADLIKRKAHFITRAHSRLRHRCLAFKPLDPAHPEIVADELVLMGTRSDRTELDTPLRRIELVTDTETLVFLTTRLDLPAFTITELYRRRWQIEIVFRWFKRVVGCLKPLAYSANAAEHTLYAALVAYLLTLLLADIEVSTKTKRPTARIKRALAETRACLYDQPRRKHLQALGFA
jgi:hypothetical protein